MFTWLKLVFLLDMNKLEYRACCCWSTAFPANRCKHHWSLPGSPLLPDTSSNNQPQHQVYAEITGLMLLKRAQTGTLHLHMLHIHTLFSTVSMSTHLFCSSPQQIMCIRCKSTKLHTLTCCKYMKVRAAQDSWGQASTLGNATHVPPGCCMFPPLADNTNLLKPRQYTTLRAVR